MRIATLGAYPLMDNTEARYAEIARKMVETGDWVTPQFQYGVPFWSKPPLSTWLTAVTYLVWASTSSPRAFVAGRMPRRRLVDVELAGRGAASAGPQAALVLFTTPLFFISAGAVMTDPALSSARRCRWPASGRR